MFTTSMCADQQGKVYITNTMIGKEVRSARNIDELIPLKNCKLHKVCILVFLQIDYNMETKQ